MNACVLLRTENIVATPNPLLSLALLRDEQRLSLGEFVDGSYCNTPGVCHPLSNGFKLNHDMFSGDGDVKVKPMEMSPNLNSDIAPLLYI